VVAIDRVSLLDLLRKAGLDEDVDFLYLAMAGPCCFASIGSTREPSALRSLSSMKPMVGTSKRQRSADAVQEGNTYIQL